MQDELYHWGIKGMHWGVRRYQNPDGTLTEAGKRRYGSQYRTYDEAIAGEKSNKRVAKALKTGRTRRLSDDELRRVTDRLRAEQTVSQMYSNLNPKRESRAKRVIAEIAENAAKDLARKAFTKLGEKIFDSRDDETNEYSISELSSLSDKQLKAYAERQQNKAKIIGIEYGKGATVESVKKKQEEEAKKRADQAKREEELDRAAKEASRMAKDLERELKADRKAEQKAQRKREKEEERIMRENMANSKYDSWMKDDYATAFNFSFNPAAKKAEKKTKEYASLKIDDIFDSEDDYYDSVWGSDRKRKDLAKWSDIGEDFLAHHGIKGQKWGVRRYQNPDGTLTEDGKSRYYRAEDANNALKRHQKDIRALKIKSAVKRGAVNIAGLSFAPVTFGASLVPMLAANKAILDKDNEKYKKLITEDNPVKSQELFLPKGTKLERTSLVDAEEGSDRLYASLAAAKYDKEYYTKIWPNMLRKIAKDENANVYRNSYDVNTNIIAPSYEKRKQIAMDLLNANKKLRIELGREVVLKNARAMTGRFDKKSLSDFEDTWSKKEINDIIKKANKEWSGRTFKTDDDFKTFVAVIPTSTKLMNRYISELKKEGYEAVFDDNAASSGAFIVFDPSVLGQTGSRLLKK